MVRNAVSVTIGGANIESEVVFINCNRFYRISTPRSSGSST
ncbi:hypothetical protein DSUL_260043 [Desulfovibrionales bacterium]